MPDIDTLVRELREERAPSDMAQLTLERIDKGTRRPPMRLALIAGLLVAVLLPAVLLSGRVQAMSLKEVVAASGSAPYVVCRSFRVTGSRKQIVSEQLFGPERRVERTFFGPTSMRETRHLPGRIFERYLFHNEMGFKPYETIDRSDEPVHGTESQAVAEELLRQLKRLGKIGDLGKGERVDGLIPLKGESFTAWIDPDDKRLRRLESAGGFVSEWEYPERIDPNRLGIPPAGWTWPDDWKWLSFRVSQPLARFDLEHERQEFVRLLRTGTARTGGAKLVGVFQSVTDPGMPMFVTYETGQPAVGQERLAKVQAATGPAGVTTIRRMKPKVYATVVQVRPERRWTRATVEVPEYGPAGRFLRYVEFRDVPVLAYSNQLRSSLRDIR